MMIRGRFALSREAATYTRHRTFQLTFNLVQLVAEMCEHRPPSSTTTFPSTVSVDCRLTVWTWDSMLQGSHTEWEMVSEKRCWKIYFNGKSCEAWKKNGCIFSELVEYEKKNSRAPPGHTARERYVWGWSFPDRVLCVHNFLLRWRDLSENPVVFV